MGGYASESHSFVGRGARPKAGRARSRRRRRAREGRERVAPSVVSEGTSPAERGAGVPRPTTARSPEVYA
jgi:hypothetical protein